METISISSDLDNVLLFFANKQQEELATKIERSTSIIKQIFLEYK
jgi:type II secretory pathway component PulF